jgi:hypothetical protein
MGRRKKEEKGKEGERDFICRANLEAQHSRVARIGKQRRTIRGISGSPEVGKKLPRLARELQ